MLFSKVPNPFFKTRTCFKKRAYTLPCVNLCYLFGAKMLFIFNWRVCVKGLFCSKRHEFPAFNINVYNMEIDAYSIKRRKRLYFFEKYLIICIFAVD